MIPRLKRFSNPHFLPDSTKIVSRSELYIIEGGDTQICFTEDPTAVAHLNELLSENIALARHEPNLMPSASKKRKITELEDTQDTRLEEPILFRLVSSALPPLPISLLPPPPPPPITREPDVEDNEVQARLRQQCAKSVSVNGETILRESLQSLANPKSKVSTMVSKFEKAPPSIMIIRTLQLPRKTRPPVPSSDFMKYPYGSDNCSLNVEPVAPKTGSLFTIDAQGENELSTTPRKKGRRRRKNDVKERPIPQFWRPSSTLTGKCRGYAYGYPSYLASAMGSQRKRYTRDSMKKGILLDNS